MAEASSNNEKVSELGQRAGELAKVYSLTDAQAAQLTRLGVDTDFSDSRADYSFLHNWASENFAQQLKELNLASRELSAEQIKTSRLSAGHWSKYYEYNLGFVALPNGTMLQPGTFVVDHDKVVRGTMEMRNEDGKGVGIQFSECYSDDYPEFFTRPDPNSKRSPVQWDHSGGNRMKAIQDAWVTRDSETGLSKMEAIIIGMMQEKNRRSVKEKTTTETSRTEEREKILKLLDL